MRRSFAYPILVLWIVLIALTGRADYRHREFPSPSPSRPLPRHPSRNKVVGKRLYLPILVYHLVRPVRKTDPPSVRKYNVPPAVFEEQLKYLKENGYTAITFEQLAAGLLHGAELPAKPVIICFDDGWENQYRYALPVLKKYGFVATFFLYPHVIGKKNYLSWDQVNELVAAGMAIGSHGLSHPYLDRITDEKRLREEIFTSKRILEEKIGKPVTAFAYPFGQYNPRVIELLKAVGYTTARTIRWGSYHTKDDLLTLRAYLVPANLADFLVILRFHSPGPE